MITMDQARTLQGKTLFGEENTKLGTIHTLYADREDGDPTFATVQTGMFGSKTSFVPLAEATLQGDDVFVPYSKQQVSDAPNVDEDSDLERPRMSASTRTTASAADGDQHGHDGDRGRDRDRRHRRPRHQRPTTDSAMTRSEEQLRVGTAKTEVGRARLRKFVVTENVTQTVPVSREEVRIEREPITDANLGDAMDGPAISEEEHEVVLHAEQPVVQKEAVPVERVRLDKETVTEQAQVNETVRKEQIEMEGVDEVYPAQGGATEEVVVDKDTDLDIHPRR
jgi:uncharacterized protein (TIGR02271 family)